MPEFETLLKLDTRSALRTAIERWKSTLTLPQAQALATHAAALAPPLHRLRVAIVHTYTSDLFEPWLALHAAVSGFDLVLWHAPYGLAMQEARPDSPLVAHQPDMTMLMLRREDLSPAIATPIVSLSVESRSSLRFECVARVQEIVGAFRAQRVGLLVLTLLPSPTPQTLGLYDPLAAASEAAWWSLLKSDIAAWMREASPSTTLLDLDEVAAEIGRANFFDRRYWLSARYPFTPQAACEFARRVMALATVLKSIPAKVLVVDADHTLWGGIIGEDGIDGIALGPDYPGNAYVEFQRRLLDFQSRGFLLAMCSKNNPADVDQVLREHPHQVLRDEHFAARRVNWEPKADNLVSLSKELNLGLDSFVFVDDSDHECAAIRDRLPEVEVVQVPSRVVDIATCLDRVARLEVLSLTAEDLAKTVMYAHERQRRALLAPEASAPDGPPPGDHLAKLKMRMRVSIDAHTHLARVSQLTRKTNQFNLTTRRYDEEQMRAFMDADNVLVADFSLSDIFGDAGIVGVAVWRLINDECAELDTFLMSCRVIGREAESAFLHATLRLLAEWGINRVTADYLPTAKNELVRQFLPQQGFASTLAGRWERDLRERPPAAADAFPIEVDVRAPNGGLA